MAVQKNWRLILDKKNDGYLNMAIDEALLYSYLATKLPTLRIYGWNRPFISIGYNQDARKILKPESKIPFVRRFTGGAAILHDKEVTYSITCSLEDLDLPREVKKSYEKICSFIKEFYKHLGLEAEFAKYLFSENIGRYENFCFSSYEHFDFVINGKKIGGNAQRRKHNVIFQHGSIPQEINFNMVYKTINNSIGAAAKTSSLNDLLSHKTDFDKLLSLLSSSFESCFNIKLFQSNLSREEEASSRMFLEKKYRQTHWNFEKKQV